MSVVCCIQGSFGPPHLGHKGLSEHVGNNLLRLYSDAKKIQVLFMPTSNISSKASISKKSLNPSEYVSEEDRQAMLQIYCDELNKEFKGKNIVFSVSTIEYSIQPEKKSTATVHTLREIRKELCQKEDCTFVLAIGEDNARQFPWWSYIDEWPGLIDKLLLVDRLGQNKHIHPSTYKITSYNKAKNTLGFDGPPWKGAPDYETMINKPGIAEALSALAEKTELLPQPPGYSSSEVRKILNSYYLQGGLEQKITFKKLEELCGEKVAKYLVSHSIGNPTQVKAVGGKRNRKSTRKTKRKNRITRKK